MTKFFLVLVIKLNPFTGPFEYIPYAVYRYDSMEECKEARKKIKGEMYGTAGHVLRLCVPYMEELDGSKVEVIVPLPNQK